MSREEEKDSTLVVVGLKTPVSVRLQQIAKAQKMTIEEAAAYLLTYSVNDFPLDMPRVSPEVGIEL